MTSLFKRRDRVISHPEALAVFREAGGLPLAMRQFASFILSEELSVAQFLQIYRIHRSSKTVDAWEDSITPWYSHTLATFLDVAFAKLTPGAFSILAIISFLDEDRIHESLLYEAVPEADGEVETAFPDRLK